ncbi:MAG: 23S rRNA (adenine(2503)-C(2))-methyltransferase RlmN [Tannerella sp.]|jgi:23S rRNA (adenine2503-C2)-methyltransferase|nr:23S rRNA (adenine(2503)-C(2))-methyltransferase RlmN [Tannerella sp.]
MEPKIPLLGMTLEELKVVAAQAGLPAYAAGQLADWLYRKKVATIAEMTNIAAAKRAVLEATYEVGACPPVEEMKSADGTVKYLFPVAAGRSVETVFIPADERATLCVSSQVGCKMNCLFCMTGKQGFAAHLTAHEIVNQIHSAPESDRLTNVVFMGMGEPFDNTDALFKALEILTAPYGYGWSPKRITVSTAGILKGLQRFLEESACHLAISLHSPYPEERLSLMPVEKACPEAEVIRLIKAYDFAHQRRVSFEYILFEKKNDSVQHAVALARLLKGIPCRVNLIRFHAIPGVPLQSSDPKQMELFRDTLNAKGVICTIRASRGEDILAACGMLSGKQIKDACP